MKKILLALTLVLGAVYFSSCHNDSVSPPNTSQQTSTYTNEVAVKWFDLELRLIKQTPGFSPPVASRSIGYTGITLYESVVGGMPQYRSMAGMLNSLNSLPVPSSDKIYHWPTCANTSVAFIIKKLFFNASAQNKTSIDSLEAAFNTTFQSQASEEVINNSKEFGTLLATAIHDWSVSDGGFEGQLHNTDPNFVPPVGPGLWVVTPPAFAPAIQPHWGDNRPFITVSVSSCQPGPHPTYSTNTTSQFYTQALEVYTTFNKLTQEERNIALFWADGGGTYTPPGHSIAITSLAITLTGSKLDLAAFAYAKVGIGVSDAFISCWKTKFTYNLLRPVSYIRAQIDPSWLSLITTPPFAEYTSGHSVQSGATARILSDIFGYNFSFTDNSHSDLGYAPRSFSSFYEFANEAAISRLYGGIHYRVAIEKGITQGIEIGVVVASLNLYR